MINGTKLPHSLRLVIFFLRIALGLNFFYLGFSTIFNAPLGKELGARSLVSLYAWLNATSPVAPTASLLPYFQWGFMIIGVCLFFGLFARFMSFAAMTLILVGYVPSVNFSAVTASQFINDEVLVVICLLVLIFGNAGSYLGVDRFIHIHLSAPHKK